MSETKARVCGAQLMDRETADTATLLEYYRTQWESLGRAIERKERDIEKMREIVAGLSRRRARFSQLGGEIMQGAGYAQFMADTLAGTGGQP
jgi:hypothetical protein